MHPGGTGRCVAPTQGQGGSVGSGAVVDDESPDAGAGPEGPAMDTDRPRLRPVSGEPVGPGDGAKWALHDPEGLFQGEVVVSAPVAVLLSLLDGTRTRAEVAAAFSERAGLPATVEDLAPLFDELDRHLLLEGRTAERARGRSLASWRALPARPAVCAGSSYPEDAAACGASLDAHILAAEAAPVPSSVRALLAPHIDLRGGGACHGAAARAYRNTDADTFLVIGTAHAPLRRPFALTGLAFDTPLGRLPTDRGLVERLARRGGGELMTDELAHRDEHSVEFQALWLRHVLGTRPGLSIVPVLAAGLHRFVEDERSPRSDPAIADFVAALRELAREMGPRLCIVASVDLAHVGPKYGDDDPVTDAAFEPILAADRTLLDRVVARDAEGWFEGLAAERDRRNVCGAAPTYVLLSALEDEPLTGTLLRHDAWTIDPETSSRVSFATVAFGPAGQDGPGRGAGRAAAGRR